MNALVSSQWLKEYVGFTETPAEFASRVSLSGPGVERLYPQDVAFEKIVVGQIRAINAHPGADKLRVTTVDIGTSEPLTIVCGGSNLAIDQFVVVALVGSKVRWHGEGELIELVPTTIRGVASEGMICAADEIGLKEAFPSKEEKEILDLGNIPLETVLKPGLPLAEALGYAGDTIMDVEVTTNRPDAMGMVGMARETAAILERPFLWRSPPAVAGQGTPLAVQVQDERCSRYMAVRVDGITVEPSPWWLQRRLIQAGLRPINNIVDISNYVMLELGQPMHAFDAAKLQENQIIVRGATAGETIVLLNGSTAALPEGTLVIADANRPVAVAGIMGGTDSSVQTTTTSIVFEAAVFDAVSIRRTARALNIYSDAQLRFEKGLSTQSPPDALARCVELCLTLAGGHVASQVFDHATAYVPRTYTISTERIQGLIGVPLAEKDMQSTLERLGFEVTISNGQLTGIVPWWRDHDVEDGRDFVEEIARVYGYPRIPAIYPAGISPRPTDAILRWEDRLKTIVAGAGYTEVYSYSFVSRELLQEAGYGTAEVLAVSNPLSADLEVMRPSLLPSMIHVVIENQERARVQHLFEVAHEYHPRTGDLPEERLHLSAAVLGGANAWKEAKGLAEHICATLGLDHICVTRLEHDSHWHPGRSLELWSGETCLGAVGELHPRLAEAFKVEGTLALVDLDLVPIFALATTNPGYVPVSIYPDVRRDLAVVVGKDVSVESLEATMKSTASVLTSIEWFDTYTGKGMEEGKKSVAFHLIFRSLERTLEAKEVDEALQRIEKTLQETVGASRRV